MRLTEKALSLLPGWAASAAAFAVAGALAFSGGLPPIDHALGQWRFRTFTRPASQSIAYVDIDSRSLSAIGVWPWPRHIHGDLLSHLMADGANDVVFDVDFSARSTDSEDQAFAKSLEDAGGYAHLAAFRQQQGTGNDEAFNIPLALFAHVADPVAVNVRMDPDGLVRTYPTAIDIGGKMLPSAATLLAGKTAGEHTNFGIDYSINPETIPRFSATDLMEGKVDPALIAGKNIIIGASAVELRDLFAVPRYGVLPGALLQALAGETLKQDRALRPVGPIPVVALVALIAGLGLGFRRRAPLLLALPLGLAGSALVEGGAMLLQQNWALLINTSTLHLAIATAVLSVLGTELVARGLARRKAEDRLRYLGTHDPLTGALNRNRFVEVFAAQLRDGKSPAVLMIDLRRFRTINDTLGHNQGDRLLQQVVGRLEACGFKTISRLGGGSFALLTPETDPDTLKTLGNRLIQLLTAPYKLQGGHEAIIAVSIGGTTADLSGRDANTLVAHADMALSAAKQEGGHALALFAPAMKDRLAERQAMDVALRESLEKRQFSLAYQPQVDMTTNTVVGAEALLRWVHPELGPLSPARFVPVAEETGLVVELGRWVLLAACQEAAKWPENVKIAVNVSPIQFELTDVVADVEAALEASGLDPKRLEIEITEGVFVKNLSETVERLEALRGLGIEIALDDFGTGYSSLSYLATLPIDKIKIDQSFVRRLPGDAQATAIIQTVVTLGLTLGKRLIAEGIETEDQGWMLNAMGCRLAQGYLYGKPMSAEQFASRLPAPAMEQATTAVSEAAA